MTRSLTRSLAHPMTSLSTSDRSLSSILRLYGRKWYQRDTNSALFSGPIFDLRVLQIRLDLVLFRPYDRYTTSAVSWCTRRDCRSRLDISAGSRQIEVERRECEFGNEGRTAEQEEYGDLEDVSESVQGGRWSQSTV